MSQVTIAQAMHIALAHHQGGRLGEAEQMYRQILAQDPRHPDALHHLGMLAHRGGRFDMAADLMTQSIVLRPDSAIYHLNFGTLLSDRGDEDKAIASYTRALQLDPTFAPAHFNMGNSLNKQGKLAEAAAAYARAIQFKPDFVEAHVRLGVIYCTQGLFNEGGNAFQRAANLKPDHADAFTGLTYVLTNLGRDQEALAFCRRAIALRPTCADDYNNLGILLNLQDKLEEAHAAYLKTLELKPAFLEAWNNLGNLLTEQQKLDEAFAAYGRASEIDPTVADPHFNQAWVMLLRGDLERGWRGHEWRWGTKNFSSPRTDFRGPQWDGTPLRGKTILLHAEQGIGDAIQFVRYAPMVARRGGRVVVQCAPSLTKLFSGVEGIEQIVTEEVIPTYDVHCPLMSLPLVFNTRLDSIPAGIPYVKPEAALADAWEPRFRSALDNRPRDGIRKLRVGLSWQGRMTVPQQRKRAIAFSQLTRLAKVNDVIFFSLQKGDAAAQAADRPPEMDFIDFTAGFHDLADTAAFMSHLDLVISIDTAVAHLAGAMGKPVWTLLPYKPDWRWMLGRSDSPWYPTMRLFRQTRPGDWTDVVSNVFHALSDLAGSRP